MDTKPKLRRTLSKRKQLEQNLAHVNQEMYQRNADLAQTNRTLSLLRAVDTLVLEADGSIQSLCNQMAKAIVENSEYSWIAIFGTKSETKRIDLLGYSKIDASNGSGISGNTETTWAHLDNSEDWFHKDSKVKIFNLAETTSKSLAEYLHCDESVIINLRDDQHIGIIYFIKLIARQGLVGVMAVGFPAQVQRLEQDDEVLINRISEAVGIAVDNRLLFEENERVLRELQLSNRKLRALDETKDDFISMASHQLRTPLTSVKGYTSMVLDGDAGKLTAKQKKLLTQSFASSQRMVYLIADLLNISRLKTGKFVIERSPTNLANVIEEEISQLGETVQLHELVLNYKKPKNFPALNLDETKTRQVIMNFIDNSIYYTPKGGHIDINLEDKPESIEFTVTDNGIGVPRQEAHHLFSKFYRAVNARKARPDGTGLGLFMAKKVIIAQGGAVIFQSQEGKGSTFGFSFPKDNKVMAISSATKTKMPEQVVK